VPAENVIKEKGFGFKFAMMTLDGGRIGIASQAIGIARASLDASLKYVKERKAFDKLLHEFQAIQFKIADMHTNIEAAHLLTLNAALKKDRGSDLRRRRPWRNCSPQKLRLTARWKQFRYRRLRLPQGFSCGKVFERREDHGNI